MTNPDNIKIMYLTKLESSERDEQQKKEECILSSFFITRSPEIASKANISKTKGFWNQEVNLPFL